MDLYHESDAGEERFNQLLSTTYNLLQAPYLQHCCDFVGRPKSFRTTSPYHCACSSWVLALIQCQQGAAATRLPPTLSCLIFSLQRPTHACSSTCHRICNTHAPYHHRSRLRTLASSTCQGRQSATFQIHRSGNARGYHEAWSR